MMMMKESEKSLQHLLCWPIQNNNSIRQKSRNELHGKSKVVSALHSKDMDNWMMILFFWLLNFFFSFWFNCEYITPFIKKVESQCWIQIGWRTRLRIELIIEQNKTKKGQTIQPLRFAYPMNSSPSHFLFFFFQIFLVFFFPSYIFL